VAKDKNIPTRSRHLVRQRDMVRCGRCGSPTTLGQWHHRRTRGEVRPHRHCPCNGVWLCPACHVRVHQNPEASRDLGFIVSRHEDDPRQWPIKMWHGWVMLTCDSDFSTATIPDLIEATNKTAKVTRTQELLIKAISGAEEA
jgi:hypothetical protein